MVKKLQGGSEDDNDGGLLQATNSLMRFFSHVKLNIHRCLFFHFTLVAFSNEIYSRFVSTNDIQYRFEPTNNRRELLMHLERHRLTFLYWLHHSQCQWDIDSIYFMLQTILIGIINLSERERRWACDVWRYPMHNKLPFLFASECRYAYRGEFVCSVRCKRSNWLR